jgi:predicted kinase
MENQTLNKEVSVDKEITTIDLRMHTIILLIGPSGCGKTYFTENNFIPAFEEAGVSFAHISSDNIRRELLGDYSISKQDPRMMHASKQAFKFLDAKVRALTSYPINTEFVVIDSTGLSKDFRDDIKKIADDNNYNLVVVMFDYKGRTAYYDYITDEESKAVTSRQIDYMRESVMSEVSKKTYRDIYRIKSRDFQDYKTNIINLEQQRDCVLPSGLDYTVIGDIHGCYDEFVALLEKNGFEINDGKISHQEGNKRIVLVGDLVDKGYNVKGVIELIYDNLDLFYMTKGNHENFVYRFLKDDIDKKDLPPQDVIDTYFDSVKLFESDEELKQKFFAVVEVMKPFLKHEEDDFIVTHAPCDQKYLGKLGAVSERNQRTIVYPKEVDFPTPQDYLEAKSKFFKFFRDQASKSLPVHLFGHVSTKGMAKLYNKINIDSGAVSGGHLTSININKSGRHFMNKVSSQGNDKVIKKELTYFFELPPAKISLDTLEGREKGRVLTAAEKKVNFISGTICPADKILVTDEDKNVIIGQSQIESLKEGIEYFRRKGITKLVAQPKYMGSRANIYLFKDPEKNYTTSRGGFVIKPEQIDLTEAYKPLYELPYIKEAFSKNTELLILDAELLPWSAIGKGLIERSFVTVDKAIESEIEFLKKTGFENALNKVYEGPYKDCDFDNISHKTSKKELADLLGSNNEKTFRCIKDYMREFVSLDELSELRKIYSRQIELYGADGEVHFKVFSILKEVFEDGTEKLFFDESNAEIYAGVNTDTCLVVDINIEDDILKLFGFYNKTTVIEEMEGIMLKPLQVYVKGVAPAIKVRNPRYLTIVYGPDYQNQFKLEKLIKRKKINKKLDVSVKEWEIGKRILEIPYHAISKDNQHFIQAYGEMVLEERNEKELDPRL